MPEFEANQNILVSLSIEGVLSANHPQCPVIRRLLDVKIIAALPLP
jgi:hypothetical protein